MIRKLDWESNFFNMECGQFNPLNRSEGKYSEKLFNQFDWVQGKCLISDELSKSIFGEFKFVFEDTRVIFEKIIEKKDICFSLPNLQICNSKPEEIPELQSIAIEELVKHSRLPILVGKKATGNFYARWVEKAVFQVFDDICFTLCEKNRPIGFITLKYINANEAKIGLIAIKKDFQGKRFGNALIQFSENFLYDNKFKKLSVITEGRNINAQQFYIKYGFNIKDIECWYYRRNRQVEKKRNI
ncbi:MAG: GNAT family N-acetyltransferase [Hydrogenimonas sp.]|nr:GNAT family N-acetyltransferase [Hydrogenimonas sp.]